MDAELSYELRAILKRALQVEEKFDNAENGYFKVPDSEGGGTVLTPVKTQDLVCGIKDTLDLIVSLASTLLQDMYDD